MVKSGYDANVTGVTYIRNAFTGAFCLFESMASMLPFVRDMIVLDFGSTDKTVEVLEDICAHNTRIVLEQKHYSNAESSVLIEAANDCISLATCDNVLLWQADEIWHEHLLSMMAAEFAQEHYDLSFWRIQLRNNFQEVKWFPHRVHRVGPKNNFRFTHSSMNTKRVFGVPVCSTYQVDNLHWGRNYRNRPIDLPIHEMVLDVSKDGGFLDGTVGRAKLHAPMWNEHPNISGEHIEEWYASQKNNPQWDCTTTSYNIPHIMRRHLGRRKYVLDVDILDALKRDETRELLNYEA